MEHFHNSLWIIFLSTPMDGRSKTFLASWTAETHIAIMGQIGQRKHPFVICEHKDNVLWEDVTAIIFVIWHMHKPAISLAFSNTVSKSGLSTKLNQIALAACYWFITQTCHAYHWRQRKCPCFLRIYLPDMDWNISQTAECNAFL